MSSLVVHGLREDRFGVLLDNMLAVWEAADIEACATWFERAERVEAMFDAIEHRIDLVTMNYAVHQAIPPDAPFVRPISRLVDREEARSIFETNMMRVVMGAAGVWRKDDLEIARGYFA